MLRVAGIITRTAHAIYHINIEHIMLCVVNYSTFYTAYELAYNPARCSS